jgi:hypothetical protein
MRLSYTARRVQCTFRPRVINVSSRRTYAVQQPGAPSISVFSNATKQQQRSRAAADIEESRATDYLRNEVAAPKLSISVPMPATLVESSHYPILIRTLPVHIRSH